MSDISLLSELTWREMLYQHTDGLAELLERGPVAAYCGFDPTAPSLHVGNLVPVMTLVHLQRGGHRPIALVGGGTGLIGDPSGKTVERQLTSADIVEASAAAIHSQLERFLDFSGRSAARMRNNADWLRPLDAISFMRDVGKHFTVNYMLAKESVKARLENGISYTEFSYMLLQAYDYLELFRREKVRLQVGGSDQWGNITAGIELIRRVEGGEAHAMTVPLMTTAAGHKFGKTEAGPVWLDAARTSPYRFYQFWINADDRDTPRFLRTFTLKTADEIREMEAELAAHPERRQAQQALAADITARVHGDESARVAAELSGLLFGKATEPEGLSSAALRALRDEVPFAELMAGAAPAQREPGENGDLSVDVLDLFVAAGLIPSKGAGRRLLEQGGIYVNNRRLAADQRHLGRESLLAGEYVLLRKGAREYGLVRVTA